MEWTLTAVTENFCKKWTHFKARQKVEQDCECSGIHRWKTQSICYALCHFGPHANKNDADENNIMRTMRTTTADVLILERMNEGRMV